MNRACPTCKKSNCGNHAACARRKQEQDRQATLAKYRGIDYRAEDKWLLFLLVWLLIGMRVLLDSWSEIEDKKERRATMKLGLGLLSENEIDLLQALLDQDHERTTAAAKKLLGLDKPLLLWGL